MYINTKDIQDKLDTEAEEWHNNGCLQGVVYVMNIINNLQSCGQWKARPDMNYIDTNKVKHIHGMCEKCGYIHDFVDGHTSQYKFCPQCGEPKQ